MASVLRPFRNLLSPGNFQVPTGPCQIDWTHALANGLTVAFVAGVNGTNNIVRSGFINSSLQISPGQEGLGFDTTQAGSATNGGGPYLGSTDPLVTATAFTMYCRGYYVTANGGSPFNDLGLDIRYNDPNTNPFLTWPQIQFAGAASSMRSFWNSSGAAANLAFSNALTAPTPYSLAVTHDGSNVRNYFNGALDSTSAATSAPTFTATSYLALSFGGGNLITYCTYAWTRALAADEIFRLHLGPYSFLSSPEGIDALVSQVPYQKFRKSLSQVGNRVGSRQRVVWT